MKLKCTVRYRNDAKGLQYKAGDEFEVDAATRLYLMTDAPGCFEDVKVKAATAPKKNKAVRKPRVKK